MVPFLQKKILPLFFPPRCVGCGAWESWVCARCATRVTPEMSTVCLYCGRSLVTSGMHHTICQRCLREHDFIQIFSYGKFSEMLRNMVHSYKYDFIEELEPYLQVYVADLVQRVFLSHCTLADLQAMMVVVPVPLYRERQHWRGFNQAHGLAQGFVREFSLSLEQLLLRVNPTETQMQLSREQRWLNVKSCFAWNREYDPSSFANKLVVVVDDVATSGATLQACASSLRSVGVCNVVGVVLAHG